MVTRGGSDEKAPYAPFNVLDYVYGYMGGFFNIVYIMFIMRL